jgi:hypothetical protein
LFSDSRLLFSLHSTTSIFSFSKGLTPDILSALLEAKNGNHSPCYPRFPYYISRNRVAGRRLFLCAVTQICLFLEGDYISLRHQWIHYIWDAWVLFGVVKRDYLFPSFCRI